MVSDDTKSFIEEAVMHRLRMNQLQAVGYESIVRLTTRFAIEEFEKYLKIKDANRDLPE